MLKHLALFSLLCIGCMESSSPDPIPVQPIAAPVSGDLVMALEADASTISTLFKYAGPSNAITIRDNLSLSFGDTGIRLPAGTGFSYSLTELGGTVSFSSPKPVITTKVAGLTVHPILDRIVLRQPDQAVAYATDLFGIQHTRILDLPKIASAGPELSPQPTEPLSHPKEAGSVQQLPRRSLPGTVTVWSLDGIIENEVKDYDNFVFNPDRKCFSPLRPAIEYCQGGRTYRQLGWQGIDRFVEDSSTEFRAQSAAASAVAPAVSSPARPMAGLHSHRCTHYGTKYASYTPSVWSHTAASQGSRPDHTCPVCGTLVWNKYD